MPDIITDYTEKVRMTIMREGDWQGFNMTPELMKELATSYDTQTLKAPVVVDHMDEGPSFGHILSLEVVNDSDDKGEVRLDAIVGLTAEGSWLVESGSYPERSVFIRRDYPFEGIWYMCHISLLGAGNPRVTGMGPVVRLENINDLAAAMEVPEEELVAAFNAVKFIWSQDDEHITYRVRTPSRFNPKSLKTVDFKTDKRIKAIVGKLKTQYVPADGDKNGLVVQSLLFDKSKWDLVKAKSWIKSHTKEFKGGIDKMADDVNGTEEGTTNADQIAELTARAESAESELATVRESEQAAAAKLDRANVQSAIDTLLAAGTIVPAHVEMGLVDAVTAISPDLVIGEKSVRNIVLDCVAHATAAPVKGVKTGDKLTVVKGGVDNRDLNRLENSDVRVAPGTIEVTARARELIKEGTKVSDAYLQAKAELTGVTT